MNNFNYKVKVSEFESKIKFYFSLLFMSIEDYEVLTNNFGDNIDAFNRDTFFEINDTFNVNTIFENLKWNNDKIKLKDKTILNLFNEEEIKNYYDLYSSNNPEFNISDSNDLESFYIYMLLEKVKEKKQTEFGTIYDLFDNFLDEEILSAVANLNYDDKKTFINLFGIKGDVTFELNSNDRLKNEILIKLYSYMLSKREEADIVSIIRNIKAKEDYEYSFYDYIRLMCNDKNLSNEFIFEMLSKMDYNSKKYIKEVFGEKLDKRKKLSKDKNFKRAISNLTIVVKVNKEYQKRKELESKSQTKKKVGVEEKKQEVKQEQKNIKKEEPKKEEAKKELKQEEKKQVNKKNIEKKEEKKEKKEEKKKPDNKKTKLDKFLIEKNIDKKDFLKAVELLDPLSKQIITFYYGLKKEPIEIDEISNKLKMEQENVVDILDQAEKKIVDLIKTGEINKKDTKEKKEEKKNLKVSNDLYEFVQSKSIELGVLSAALLTLNPIEKTIVDAVLNAKENALKEVALNLNIKEEKAKSIYENASSKIISLLDINKKDEKEEKKEEVKEAKPKEENKEPKKEDKNKEKKKNEKTGSLAALLKSKNITKAEFFEIFKTLDPFSKTVMTLYLGLYSKPVPIYLIAEKYNMTEQQIENIISKAENKFTKKKESVKKISLTELLNKNKLSKDTFMKEIESLPASERNLIKDYFGIRCVPLSLEELSKKYGKDAKEINKIIEQSVSKMGKTKDKKDNDLSDKLSKFLTVNNITKKQFFKALEMLQPNDKMLVSMYFGINQKEKSLTEMAVLLNQNPLIIKNNLTSILKQINTLSKSENKDLLSENYENNKLKIKSMYNALINDVSFIAFISSNPVMANLLQMIVSFNFDLDTMSKALNISKQEVYNNVNNLSMICEQFYMNKNQAKNNSNTGFYEEENEKQVGRKY